MAGLLEAAADEEASVQEELSASEASSQGTEVGSLLADAAGSASQGGGAGPQGGSQMQRVFGEDIDMSRLSDEEKIQIIKRKIAERYIDTAPLGQDPIHVVYTLHGEEAEFALRSAWSLYTTATEDTRSRLQFHIMVSEPEGVDATFEPFKAMANITTYTNPITLPLEPKVWPSKTPEEDAIDNLPHRYWQFYLPEFMWRQHKAKRFLLLRPESLVLSDLGTLWGKIYADNKHAVASGPTQGYCKYGMTIKVMDERLRSQELDPSEPCIQTGSMFFDVKNWMASQMEARATQLLATNAERKLYMGGALAPMLILLHDNYDHLPKRYVFDNKHKECCENFGENQAGILSPVHDITIAAWQTANNMFKPPWLTHPILAPR